MLRVLALDTFDPFLELANLFRRLAFWRELGCGQAFREGMLVVDPLVQDHRARHHLVLVDGCFGLLVDAVVDQRPVDHDGRRPLRQACDIDGCADRVEVSCGGVAGDQNEVRGACREQGRVSGARWRVDHGAFCARLGRRGQDLCQPACVRRGHVGRVRAQLNTRVQLPDRVVGSDGRERPATRPSTSRQRARAEDDAAPATQNQRPVDGSDSPEAADAQTRAASPNKATDTGPNPPGEASVEPTSDGTTGPDPTRPGGERSGTGVTARQSARDRSNRIVSVVADDVKHLTAQEDLIDFTALDPAQLPKWIEELEEGRSLLGRFIRRLRKEVQDGVPSAPITD